MDCLNFWKFLFFVPFKFYFSNGLLMFQPLHVHLYSMLFIHCLFLVISVVSPLFLSFSASLLLKFYRHKDDTLITLMVVDRIMVGVLTYGFLTHTQNFDWKIAHFFNRITSLKFIFILHTHSTLVLLSFWKREWFLLLS